MEYLELFSVFGIPVWVGILLLFWTLIWKAIALWKSARNNHLVWFIILFLVNFFGILEILYIFVFSKKQKKAKRKK